MLTVIFVLHPVNKLGEDPSGAHELSLGFLVGFLLLDL